LIYANSEDKDPLTSHHTFVCTKKKRVFRSAVSTDAY